MNRASQPAVPSPDNRDFKGVEDYRLSQDGRSVSRRVRARSRTFTTELPLPGGVAGLDPAAAFDAAWLRSREPRHLCGVSEVVTMVDLFSGCGAMSLGVEEACRAVGLSPRPLLAVDTSERALAVYQRNFPSAEISSSSVTDLIDGEVGSSFTPSEARLKERLGHVDFLIGGPPCQGHSDLNNHTRRADPKNRLYLSMARFAEVIRPSHVIIENVPAVVHDQGNVVHQTQDALRALGYSVIGKVLEAQTLGVAQKRRRFFMIASLNNQVEDDFDSKFWVDEPRPLSWAIGDLVGQLPANHPFDTSARHAAINQARMEYLHRHGLHDLPDAQRPDCHRLKAHSYKSVYGRMFWDLPAQTITTGFGSTGQGRFVHPLEPRTLTPHEAARVQFIPDFFEFDEYRRGALQHMIGNAVPPKLSYVAALSLLTALSDGRC